MPRSWQKLRTGRYFDNSGSAVWFCMLTISLRMHFVLQAGAFVSHVCYHAFALSFAFWFLRACLHAWFGLNLAFGLVLVIVERLMGRLSCLGCPGLVVALDAPFGLSSL